MAWLGAFDDPADGLGAHPQVERDEDQARPHRAQVRRRELGCRGRPGEHAVTWLQAERAQPPRGDPAAAVELGIRPAKPRARFVAEGERRSIAVPRDSPLEQLEQRLHPEMLGARSSPLTPLPRFDPLQALGYTPAALAAPPPR
jgi:hypothetical protein